MTSTAVAQTQESPQLASYAIGSVKVRTLDMEKSIAFYQTVFGMEIVARTDNPYPPTRLVTKDMDGGGRSIETQLRFPGTADAGKASRAVGIVLRTLPSVKEPYRPSKNDPLMTISVQDIDGMAKHITDSGYPIYIQPFNFMPTARIMFILDPSGNDLEIIGHP